MCPLANALGHLAVLAKRTAATLGGAAHGDGDGQARGVTMHWWLGDRWSCSNCETCIMPSDHPKAKPFVQKSDQIRKKYDDWKDLVRKQADELRKAAKS